MNLKAVQEMEEDLRLHRWRNWADCMEKAADMLRAMRERIERLEERYDQTQRGNQQEVSKLREEVERLQMRLKLYEPISSVDGMSIEQWRDAARKDAERYRWLKNNPALPFAVVRYGSYPAEYYAGTSLDAAIDAALAQEGK